MGVFLSDECELNWSRLNLVSPAITSNKSISMKNSALFLTVFASSSVFAQSTAEDIYAQGVIGAASVIGIILLIGIYKSGKILLNWLRKMPGQSKISKALINAEEEALYAQAASEVAEGDIRPGLWAKATSAVEGDEKKARARYIGLRVEQLQFQVNATGAMAKALPLKKEGSPTPETHVRCPDCRAFIRREASVCIHCECKLIPQ